MDLRLYVPQYHELTFRERLLADPASMSFRRGGAGGEGDHPDTGCLDFPRSAWALWYEYWIDREPERFYAYVVDGDRPVGEACYYEAEGRVLAGIILAADQRGKGYCAPALRLLARRAFAQPGVASLEAEFSTAHTAALRGYRAAGFRVVRRGGGSCLLRLSRPAE